MHAIWGCRSLKSVRDAWPAVVVLGDTKNAWLVDFMIACGHSLSCEDLGLHNFQMRLLIWKGNMVRIGLVIRHSEGRSDLNRTRGRKKTVRNVFTYRYSS
ncbi:hypothetical protein QYF36_025871 [Acer negundo]|nr:hypothetical protein QYF36_025871 [Acer negundo]